jgi:hypothetical protein
MVERLAVRMDVALPSLPGAITRGTEHCFCQAVRKGLAAASRRRWSKHLYHNCSYSAVDMKPTPAKVVLSTINLDELLMFRK